MVWFNNRKDRFDPAGGGDLILISNVLT